MAEDVEKLAKLFNRFEQEHILKGHLYSAVTKNAQKGKAEYNKVNFSEGFLIQKGFLKGFSGKGRYTMSMKRSDFLTSSDYKELRGVVYNKIKFKKKGIGGIKSGFHYNTSSGTKNYADKFIYKRMEDPIKKVDKVMKDDLNKGIQIACKDALKRGGFE